MKYFTIASITSFIILVSLVLPSTIQAQTQAGQTNPETQKRIENKKREIERTQKQIEALQEKQKRNEENGGFFLNLFRAKNKIASTTISESVEQRQARIEEKVKKYTDQLLARLKASVDRLTTLNERLDSRISKLDTEGINTSYATGYSSEAKKNIKSASDEIMKLEETLAGLENTEKLNEIFASTKKSTELVRKELILAHQYMAKAVSSLKQGTNKSSTTTPTSNN